MGNTRPRPTAENAGNPANGRVSSRADDEIRTRDPHLGKKKVTNLARRDRSTALSSLSSVSSSAQPAESAPLQQLTFNALNLYPPHLTAMQGRGSEIVA